MFTQLNEWFAANLLYLHFKKKLNICSLTKNTSVYEISIGYNNMFISNTSNTKFLGLIITNSLSWKHHITQLTPKLYTACYVHSCIRLFMSQDALKSVYYSSFHSLISYGIIFWGNSSNSLHVFWLQKQAIRIITGSRPKDSCRGLFKKLSILPLQSRYILSLLLFIVNVRIFSMLIQKYTVLILGKILTFISLKLTYQSIRNGLTILALKFLIVSHQT